MCDEKWWNVPKPQEDDDVPDYTSNMTHKKNTLNIHVRREG